MSGVSGTVTPARTFVGGVEGILAFVASAQSEFWFEVFGEEAEDESELYQRASYPFIFIFHIGYTKRISMS